jgi:hypothetical protein
MNYDYMTDLEEAVIRLLDERDRLRKEVVELRKEVVTFTSLVRDMHWKINGVINPYGDKYEIRT